MHSCIRLFVCACVCVCAYLNLCVCVHTPVIKGPFTGIADGSQSAEEETATADCESSSSHDRLLHRNTILHFTLTNMLWSVQNFCGFVSCEKHPLVEHCTFVVDLIEQQGDQMAKRLTRSQSVTSLFPICITNVVVKDVFLCRKKKSYNLVVCIVLVVHMCLNFRELGVSSCWNKVKLKNSASLNKKKHPFHTIS